LSEFGARRTVGLVGGLGVGATIHYYERLASAFAEQDAESNFGTAPRLVISHADLKQVLALVGATALDDLAEYLKVHVVGLSRAGAGLAAIGAVTPHICAAQLKQKIDLPLIDLVDCVRTELTARRVRRVAVLGTRFVMESDLFGRLADFQLVRTDPVATEFVHANYMQIAATGSTTGVDIDGMTRIARRLVEQQGADVVVLAGTELSLAFDAADCGFPALDCAQVHIDAIIKHACGEATLEH
jgi:aspartate racemase